MKSESEHRCKLPVWFLSRFENKFKQCDICGTIWYVKYESHSGGLLYVWNWYPAFFVNDYDELEVY